MPLVLFFFCIKVLDYRFYGIKKLKKIIFSFFFTLIQLKSLIQIKYSDLKIKIV